MPNYKWRGEVPFKRNGDLGGPGDGSRQYIRKWYSFNAEMTVTEMHRGRSAANFILQDEQGKKYTIFMVDLLEIMQTVGVRPGGKIKGHWGFCKRGYRYGVYLMEVLTKEDWEGLVALLNRDGWEGSHDVKEEEINHECR